MKKSKKKSTIWKPNHQLDIFDIIGEDDRPPPQNIKVHEYKELYLNKFGEVNEITIIKN